MSVATGTLLGSRGAGVALVAIASVATRGCLPGVLSCGAGAVAGLKVATGGAAFSIARSTSITEGKPALAVVVTVGTFTRTDGVRPSAVVLAGFEVRLTTVLVTYLLATGVVGLVKGVVSTVTVSRAALGVTTGSTIVLCGPHVVTKTGVVGQVWVAVQAEQVELQV